MFRGAAAALSCPLLSPTASSSSSSSSSSFSPHPYPLSLLACFRAACKHLQQSCAGAIGIILLPKQQQQQQQQAAGAPLPPLSLGPSTLPSLDAAALRHSLAPLPATSAPVLVATSNRVVDAVRAAAVVTHSSSSSGSGSGSGAAPSQAAPQPAVKKASMTSQFSSKKLLATFIPSSRGGGGAASSSAQAGPSSLSAVGLTLTASHPLHFPGHRRPTALVIALVPLTLPHAVAAPAPAAAAGSKRPRSEDLSGGEASGERRGVMAAAEEALAALFKALE